MQSNDPQEKTNVREVPKNKDTSFTTYVKKYNIAIVIVVIILVGLLGFFFFSKKNSQINNSQKAYSLQNKESYIVINSDSKTALLYSYKGTKVINNNSTTFIYINTPPHEKKVSFTALKSRQQVDMLTADKNTIIYIVKLLDAQAISIASVNANSQVSGRSLSIPNQISFMNAINKAKWIYDSPPPKTLTVTLASKPQKFVFIKGPKSNAISTSSVINGKNVTINLYIEPNYLKTEDPTLINNFASGAIVSAIFSGFDPTQSNKDLLNNVSTALKDQKAFVSIR